MTANEVTFDFARRSRIGLSEAVLCEGKTLLQLEHIISHARERDHPLLLTRLDQAVVEALAPEWRGALDFDPVSRTGIISGEAPPAGPAPIAIVSAGSSDVAIAREAERTLAFHGVASDVIMDVGVAGLWRIIERSDELHRYRALIVVAGMDGALFSVIGGLVGVAVIAVPTATGYGVAREGTAALNSALASCAPGVVVVNIGNGYGGACAALRVLQSFDRSVSGRVNNW
jgi:hypothetical protein